jgi:NADH-quinone oxidoreductase subunit L
VPEETGGVWDTLLHGYYVDDLYGKTIVLPGKAAAEQLAFTADAKGIDGAVNGVGGLVKRLAVLAKSLQTGLARSYGVGILGGAAALVLIILVRGGW